MSTNQSMGKLQVLFIDDEPNVLSGLRRLLRSQKDRWDMHFASSGAEAIRQMDSISFDVIVSDMRMPEMDGAEVLLTAKKHAPQALRCVLSGQADRDQILRVLESAHQFASKPCDTQLLEGIVAKSQATKERLANPQLRALITSIHTLPILPKVWSELMEELVSREASIEKIADIVASDVALSAKVLQLVSSSFFGQPKHIVCPKAATKMLGLDLFIELAIRRRVLRSHEGHWPKGFSPEDFAAESQCVAQIAYELAWNKTGNATMAQEAHLGGLLHGIGKLVIAEHLPDVYVDLVSQSNINETQVEGATLVQIGCALLTMWGLPSTVVDAIADCYRPIDSELPFTVTTAVQSAIALRQLENNSAPKVMV